MSELYQEIYRAVGLVPRGTVASYGQIARLIGKPRHARHVGFALAATPDSVKVPWHRIVSAKGEIRIQAKQGYDEYQRLLLEDEGVEFCVGGKIDMARFQWQGDECKE